MEVIAFDVKPDEKAASKLNYSYVDMDALLSKSDIITLHVPGNEKTRNLISKSEFSKMMPGAVLINTSRGFVVDIEALLEALVNKKIAAAALDVLPEEPTIREEAELLRSILAERHNLETLFAGHMLAHQPNVLITPHSAFNTHEAKQRLLDTTVDNIIAFARGKPQNVVRRS
jgi:D-lactate dehydrogenase